MVPNTLSSNEGSDESVQMCRLARNLAAHIKYVDEDSDQNLDLAPHDSCNDLFIF